MTGPLVPQDDGGTELTEEEREGLIPSYITLRSELNEAEQANILEAEEWAFARKRDLLEEKFLNNLHRRMYGNVWRWAGRYRTSGKNIGIDAYQIPTDLRNLLNDVRYWIDQKTYPADEISARFHHRLTFIHCYPNGNGRHARMATDLLLVSISDKPLTWGNVDLVDPGETRDAYIAALRAADKHDIAPLVATDDARWQQVLDTNLNGTYLLFKQAARYLSRAGNGAMCAISSIAGVRTHRFMHAYCVAKSGVDMLVRTSADELGAAGIRVNSVLPGLVDTEIAQGLFATEEVHQDYLACMPLSRTGEADDIAAAVRFLCGPESSWITGVNLSVDGGHHLRRGPNYDVFARAGFADALKEARLENE